MPGVSVLAENQTYGELEGWGFFIEQDLFYLIDPDKNEDRDYTIGMEVAFYGETSTTIPLYKGRHAIDSVLGINDLIQTHDRQRILNFGVAAFTPDDLSDPNPIYDDRPYASLIYLSSKITTIAPNRNWGLNSKLTLGILGLGIAGEIQGLMHRLQREISNSDTPADPRGWSHQISDGGELTFQYGLEYRSLITKSNWYDLSYAMSGYVGYETNVSAGLLWRAGQRSSHFSSFEPVPLFESTTVSRHRRDNYLYLEYSLRGVIYNELLQGGFRTSVVTFAADQIERQVHYLALGWTMTLESGTRLTFAQYMHTPEYIGPNSRNHYWGGFYLTFPFARQ